MNNLTEIDHASKPLGIFASKSVSLSDWQIRPTALKRAAFTLAEVLITLGIIGVVAALTIPSIVSHFRKKEVETKVAHFYSVMNQAIAQSEVENGPKDTWWQNFSCSGGAYSEKCLQDFFENFGSFSVLNRYHALFCYKLNSFFVLVASVSFLFCIKG